MTCRVIFGGPFCCGKTSIIEMLQKDFGIPKLIDDTTRPKRANERDGFPYNFISEESFQNREKSGYYFETITFKGHKYGVPRYTLLNNLSWALDILSTSLPAYKEIPRVFTIYLMPPSVEVLIKRARLRGDKEEKIQERIEALKDEDPSGFAHLIPPQDSLEKTYSIVKQILGLEISHQNLSSTLLTAKL